MRILQQLRDTPELLQAVRGLTGSELSNQNRLRETWSADLVRAAIALEEVRARATRLLPQASELWLTRTALQQSTSWEVARHKARRFPVDVPVVDLCCGVGVDSAALVERGTVESVDIDAAMLKRCEWNLDAWKRGGNISSVNDWRPREADARSMAFGSRLLHIDPDRRVGRDRPAKRLEHYCPDLAWMQATVATEAGGVLKLGPASNFIQKFPKCEIELITLNGECREAAVWFGRLAGPEPFRATSLPSGETIAANPLSAYCPQATECGTYIFDPDPAVVRSGLLDLVGEMHSLQRLDKSDEYLTGSGLPSTTFVTAFCVEATLPNNLREVTKHLSRDPGSDYEVKCRHVKVDASRVQKKLPRGGLVRKTLIFARIAGRSKVIVAKRV